MLALSLMTALAGCGSSVERSLIYHPAAHLEATPADYGLPFEDARVVSDDGERLHGWLVPGPRPLTILWCHGNAGNISHRLDNLRLMHERLGASVLLFDYRGYGESTGVPSEEGTYRDARAFRLWLVERAGGRGGPPVPSTAPAPIVYFGRSLGAAVAAALAVDTPPAALILETPFTSVRQIANQTLPGAGFLFRTRYDTLARIGRIHTPLLVLHGDADEVVPFRHGRAVFEAAAEPKAFVTIPGARHNDTYVVGGEAYWRAWQRFLAAHVPDRTAPPAATASQEPVQEAAE